MSARNGTFFLEREEAIAVAVDSDDPCISELWQRASEVIHLNPATYVSQEIVPDELLTREYADRGRPHLISNRPAPLPDDDEDFLSDPCVWEFREEVRVCDDCGDVFLAHVHNHRYCSKSCQSRAAGSSHICSQCGREFHTQRQRQVYCSLVCAGIAKRNPANDRLCAQCGAPFHATRSEQRFCSRTCAWTCRKRHVPSS